MEAITRNVRFIFMLMIATSAALPLQSRAQESNDDWQVRASIYLWLAGIDANTRFPSGAGGPSIDVDAGTLVDNMNFAFMGALDVQKGAWGMFSDVVYLDEGASKNASRDFTVGQTVLPAGVDVNASLDLKSLIWTVAGTYSLSNAPQHEAEVLFGARMASMDQTLDWAFTGNIGPLQLPGSSGRSETDVTLWDAIVGVKGRLATGADGKWFIPYHLDLGTGDSDLTWQAMAGLGYEFGWGSAVLTWRYLDYELDSDTGITDMNLSGPLLGASFEW